MRLNWYKTSPEATKAMLELQRVVDSSKIEHKLLEIVKIRASQINGCAHCLDMHTKDAIAIGESEQRIHVLPAWKETTFYSPRERAALLWCEALTQVSTFGTPDNIYETVEGLFSPEEIVELKLAIVTINTWNRLAIGFKSDAGNYVSNRKPE
jgi:AhpD family alkylhydroperoxidase